MTVKRKRETETQNLCRLRACVVRACTPTTMETACGFSTWLFVCVFAMVKGIGFEGFLSLVRSVGVTLQDCILGWLRFRAATDMRFSGVVVSYVRLSLCLQEQELELAIALRKSQIPEQYPTS